MGSRSPTGVDNYFESITDAFTNIRDLLSPKATVVQIVAFTDVGTQLARYLEAMEEAGFSQLEIRIEDKKSTGHMWRQVPLRKWYAALQGPTSSAQELLLIHHKAD